MLRQIIRQSSLFDVDISRELTRPIFNSNTRIFGRKREKRRVFQNVSFSSISKELQVSIKSHMTGELLLNKYHTLSFLFLLLVLCCRTPKCAFCHRCSCTEIYRLKNGMDEAKLETVCLQALWLAN